MSHSLGCTPEVSQNRPVSLQTTGWFAEADQHVYGQELVAFGNAQCRFCACIEHDGFVIGIEV
jgi:hypothetical protein